ncbi:hypothetical protein Tco_1126925, partial [Tanacetum coccineum]
VIERLIKHEIVDDTPKGQKLMVMGTADEVVKYLEKGLVFMEDLSKEEQVAAVKGITMMRSIPHATDIRVRRAENFEEIPNDGSGSNGSEDLLNHPVAPVISKQLFDTILRWICRIERADYTKVSVNDRDKDGDMILIACGSDLMESVNDFKLPNDQIVVDSWFV